VLVLLKIARLLVTALLLFACLLSVMALPAGKAAPATTTGTPLFLPAVQREGIVTQAGPVTPSPRPSPGTTTQPASPTATRTALPSATATPTATATLPAALPACGVTNLAWTDPGRLLRGGNIAASGFACLAAAGVDTLVDQREPTHVPAGEADRAAQAGLEYLNLGIPDDRAPSPAELAAWFSAVDTRLAQGRMVLVYDAGGRGRMGFWDAAYWMRAGMAPAQAIEERYIGRALPFNGAKIGCQDGGHGQVQALADIGQLLAGVSYYPPVDEWGTAWPNCPRPDYMAGWDYAPVFGG
jgi:hypothetical protein